MQASESVFITGGSRGLGRALALEYARRGARVGLLARSADQLREVSAECLRAGAEAADFYPADVRDASAVRDALRDFAGRGLDVCFANAGVIGAGEGFQMDRSVFDVNFYGCVNTVEAALEPMRSARCGVVVVLSSFSAYRGVPTVPAYAASKAAVHNYAESLRTAAAHEGVLIKTAVLGYLDTELAAGARKPRFLVTDASTAAARLRAFARDSRPMMSYPALITWAYRLLRLLPSAAYDRLLRARYRAPNPPR